MHEGERIRLKKAKSLNQFMSELRGRGIHKMGRGSANGGGDVSPDIGSKRCEGMEGERIRFEWAKPLARSRARGEGSDSFAVGGGDVSPDNRRGE
jgi:hypothetical protein